MSLSFSDFCQSRRLSSQNKDDYWGKLNILSLNAQPAQLYNIKKLLQNPKESNFLVGKQRLAILGYPAVMRAYLGKNHIIFKEYAAKDYNEAIHMGHDINMTEYHCEGFLYAWSLVNGLISDKEDQTCIHYGERKVIANVWQLSSVSACWAALKWLSFFNVTTGNAITKQIAKAAWQKLDELIASKKKWSLSENELDYLEALYYTLIDNFPFDVNVACRVECYLGIETPDSHLARLTPNYVIDVATRRQINNKRMTIALRNRLEEIVVDVSKMTRPSPTSRGETAMSPAAERVLTMAKELLANAR